MDVSELYIWLIPLISALVGWGTNMLAVRMLFHPHRELKLGPICFQGVIPCRQQELSKDIAKTVQEHLLTPEAVEKAVSSPEIAEKLVAVFEKQIDGFLEKSVGRNPMMSSLLQSEAVFEMKTRHKAILHRELPVLMSKLIGPLSSEMSFQEHIEEELASFDLVKLESLALEVVGRELREIERLGALLGFLVGIVQVVIFQLFVL